MIYNGFLGWIIDFYVILGCFVVGFIIEDFYCVLFKVYYI